MVRSYRLLHVPSTYVCKALNLGLSGSSKLHMEGACARRPSVCPYVRSHGQQCNDRQTDSYTANAYTIWLLEPMQCKKMKIIWKSNFPSICPFFLSIYLWCYKKLQFSKKNCALNSNGFSTFSEVYVTSIPYKFEFLEKIYNGHAIML